MRPQFPNVYLTEITFDFRGDTYKVRAHNGDITVEEWYSSTDYSVLTEDTLEYWIGALIYWYDQSWNNPWTECDYRVAAYVCRAKGHVLEAADLERICGISEQYGIGPRTFSEATRALKSFEYKLNPLTEGAD